MVPVKPQYGSVFLHFTERIVSARFFLSSLLAWFSNLGFGCSLLVFFVEKLSNIGSISQNEPIKLREVTDCIPDSDNRMACYTFRATNRVYSDLLFTIMVFNNMIFCLWVVMSRLRKFGQLIAFLGRNKEETDTTLRRPVMCCLEEAETNLVARRNMRLICYFRKLTRCPYFISIRARMKILRPPFSISPLAPCRFARSACKWKLTKPGTFSKKANVGS
jgi:hypothetical protein